jgi:hypothetical protein
MNDMYITAPLLILLCMIMICDVICYPNRLTSTTPQPDLMSTVALQIRLQTPNLTFQNSTISLACVLTCSLSPNGTSHASNAPSCVRLDKRRVSYTDRRAKRRYLAGEGETRIWKAHIPGVRRARTYPGPPEWY